MSVLGGLVPRQRQAECSLHPCRRPRLEPSRSVRRGRIPDAPYRPAGKRGSALHQRLRSGRRLLADARRPDERDVPGQTAPNGPHQGVESEGQAPAAARMAQASGSGCHHPSGSLQAQRLSHGALRKMALEPGQAAARQPAVQPGQAGFRRSAGHLQADQGRRSGGRPAQRRRDHGSCHRIP